MMTMTHAEILALIPAPRKIDPTSPEAIRDANNMWSRGIDWCVSKSGRQWRLAECFGFPVLFKTKTAACEAATAKVLEDARRRAEAR